MVSCIYLCDLLFVCLAAFFHIVCFSYLLFLLKFVCCVHCIRYSQAPHLPYQYYQLICGEKPAFISSHASFFCNVCVQGDSIRSARVIYSIFFRAVHKLISWASESKLEIINSKENYATVITHTATEWDFSFLLMAC